jgi:hypothetical protein
LIEKRRSEPCLADRVEPTVAFELGLRGVDALE